MSKIVNVYIAYDLGTWPRNPTNNFKFKNCLSGATNVVKNSDTEKYVYSGYGITFNGRGSWNFDNDFARNVIIFLLEMLSFHLMLTIARKKILIVGEGLTYGITGSFCAPEKKFGISFTKANPKFCFCLHYNSDDSCFFVNEKKSLSLKLTIKMLTFQLIFISEACLMDLVILSLQKYL